MLKDPQSRPHVDGPRPQVVEVGPAAIDAGTAPATTAGALGATPPCLLRLPPFAILGAAAGATRRGRLLWGALGLGRWSRGQSRWGRIGAIGGGSSSEGGGWSRLLHGELLKTEVVAHLQKGRKRVATTKMEADGSEVLVEAPGDVEDEGVIGDELAEITEVLGYPLVAATVLGDGKDTLRERAKLLVGLEGVRRAVPKELGQWDSMASQRIRAEAPRWEMVSARSSVMVPVSQVRTTQSILTQSGELGRTSSERTWRSRENFPRVRRKDSRHRE